MTEKTIWEKLAAEFPKSAVSWRAQSLAKSGDKAMALAYLDSRDVRRRLNEVLGPGNWQNRFYDCGDGKLACEISVRVDGEWISKSDGAGETQVEAEKGAFSGALKRAAVAFGIGEYLYDMPTPWVPCETYESNGKKHWSKWIGDPWEHVKRSKQPVEEPKSETGRELADRLLTANRLCSTRSDFNRLWGHPATIKSQGILPADLYNEIETAKASKFKEVEAKEKPKETYNFDQLSSSSTVGDMLDATENAE